MQEQLQQQADLTRSVTSLPVVLCVSANYDKLLPLQPLLRASRAVCQAVMCPLAGASHQASARVSRLVHARPDRGTMKRRARGSVVLLRTNSKITRAAVTIVRV